MGVICQVHFKFGPFKSKSYFEKLIMKIGSLSYIIALSIQSNFKILLKNTLITLIATWIKIVMNRNINILKFYIP